MKQSLQLRLGQHLTMTPQLQQAIKLLTLTNLELESYIGEELERNPLLETGEREAVEPEADLQPREVGDIGFGGNALGHDR